MKYNINKIYVFIFLYLEIYSSHINSLVLFILYRKNL